MHLKALALRGFKSFADPVRLELTPGINVIVGPNGSGKSNIVDAISWVLGAQTPKALRSARMEDVIFAGYAKRGPARGAAVELVLDNSSSRLGLDMAEVAISRELSRNGDSRYELNGRECRLIDLQEILADASIGRGQHTIISQGHLDAILDAKPEERRATIEEAAGIAKYRRRQERTRRRLELVNSELERANELVRELKKRLRPLERQAAAAKRYLDLNDEISQLKSHLLGSQYKGFIAASAKAQASIDACTHEIALVEGQIAQLRAARATMDERGVDEGEFLESDLLPQVLGLQGRFDRAFAIATERIRSLESILASLEDDSALTKVKVQIEKLEGERSELEEEVLAIAPALDDLELLERNCEEAASRLSQVELAALEVSESSSAARHLELSKARAGLSRSAEALAEARSRGEARLLDYQTRLGVEQSSIALLNAELANQTIALDRAKSQAAELGEGLGARRLEEESATDSHGVARVEIGSAKAVYETLEAGTKSLHAKSHLALARTVGEPYGVLIELLDIEPGYERIVEAALAPWGTAVVQVDRRLALASYRKIKDASNRAAVVAPVAPRASLPEIAPLDGLVGVATFIRSAHSAVAELVNWLLARSYFFEGSLEDAISKSLDLRGCQLVSEAGDRISDFGLEAFEGGEVVSKRALAAAKERLEVALRHLGESESVFARARQARQQVEAELSAAENLRASTQKSIDSNVSRAARALGSQEHLVAAIEESSEALRRTLSEAARVGEEARALDLEFSEVESGLGALREKLGLARAEFTRIAAERASLRARRSAIEIGAARLHERLALCGSQIEALVLEREAQLASRQSNLPRISATAAQLERYRTIAVEAQGCSDELAAMAFDVRAKLQRQLEERSALAAELGRLLQEIEARAHKKFLLNESLRAHEGELRDATIRSEVMGERIWRELEIAPEVAAQIPILPGVTSDSAEEHLKGLQSELSALGPINQLAVLELEELNEQQDFLVAQVADITSSRSELRSVEREINKEMLEVFSAALTDIEANFAEIFQRLFAGGQASLVLTRPEDPLESGVDFEVILPGKSTRRLALLSGGERSLVALGFLFAVFQSRPSPFYVLDEVEAALDDLNLSRLLGYLADFGDRAQLIVVSHQKRTMEIAHNLFGVSMSSDGSSKVVSDRLAKRQLSVYSR